MRRSIALLSLIWLAPACGGSPAGVEDFEPPGGVRVIGFGTANEHARATAQTSEGAIIIPPQAITGMLIVRLFDQDGGLGYQSPIGLTLVVHSANNSIAYWRPNPVSQWQGQVVGLERRGTSLTFSLLREEDGVPIFQSAPIAVRFPE